jgi:hypothetical protein
LATHRPLPSDAARNSTSCNPRLPAVAGVGRAPTANHPAVTIMRSDGSPHAFSWTNSRGWWLQVSPQLALPGRITLLLGWRFSRRPPCGGRPSRSATPPTRLTGTSP